MIKCTFAAKPALLSLSLSLSLNSPAAAAAASQVSKSLYQFGYILVFWMRWMGTKFSKEA